MPRGIFKRTITDPEIRFWKKVNKNGPLPNNRPELGNCWIWERSFGGSNKSYGIFGAKRIVGKNIRVYAHRFSLELSGIKIPKGMTVDHICRNTKCVRQSHLAVVTQKENIRRGKRMLIVDKFYCGGD